MNSRCDFWSTAIFLPPKFSYPPSLILIDRRHCFRKHAECEAEPTDGSADPRMILGTAIRGYALPSVGDLFRTSIG